MALHERVEGRDVAHGGVHLFYAGRDERVHDGFADATVGGGDECGLACEWVTHVEIPDGLATRETERGIRLPEAGDRPSCLFLPLTIDRSVCIVKECRRSRGNEDKPPQSASVTAFSTPPIACSIRRAYGR